VPYWTIDTGDGAIDMGPDGRVVPGTGIIAEVLADGTSAMSGAAPGAATDDGRDLERPMHGEAQALDPMRVTPEP
ncbi:MAG TPA: hypothetical protein VFM87_04215, partial [Agrococcus sp.]|nr:hypothetical protein [Agrococcus sp.]